MKRILLAALFMLSICSVFAQKQSLRSQVNKATGDTTWITFNNNIYARLSALGSANELLGIECAKTKTGYALIMTMSTPKQIAFTIDDGQKILFRFTDKSTITLSASKNAYFKPTGSTTPTDGATNVGLKILSVYPCTRADLVKLKSGKLEFVQLQSSGGPWDYDISAKLATAHQENCAAILGK